MNKHHKREDLGITSQITTGVLVFQPTDGYWETETYDIVENAVIDNFETHQFAIDVELKNSSSNYLEFQLVADTAHKSSFNAAVDWLLDTMLDEGCQVTLLED